MAHRLDAYSVRKPGGIPIKVIGWSALPVQKETEAAADEEAVRILTQAGYDRLFDAGDSDLLAIRHLLRARLFEGVVSRSPPSLRAFRHRSCHGCGISGNTRGGRNRSR